MNLEFRHFDGAEVRVKKHGKGLEGYAAVFEKMSVDLGGYRESIRSGAFKRAIRERQDVRCLFNHDANRILGRTKSGTMRLFEDSKGLTYDCDLPDTQNARDVHAMVERGDVSGCSFSFRVQDPKNGQRWSDSQDENGSPIKLRELLDVDLFDVGPVAYPAYQQTSVDARTLFTNMEYGAYVLSGSSSSRSSAEEAARMARRVLDIDLSLTTESRAHLRDLVDRGAGRSASREMDEIVGRARSLFDCATRL